MATITINNKTYVGNSITITNGKVIIDGKDTTPDAKEINISVDGNIEELNVDACNKVFVNGSVGDIRTQSGDVDVSGDVSGMISTMSGDVKCGNVGGKISTMSGDVKHRKG